MSNLDKGVRRPTAGARTETGKALFDLKRMMMMMESFLYQGLLNRMVCLQGSLIVHYLSSYMRRHTGTDDDSRERSSDWFWLS